MSAIALERPRARAVAVRRAVARATLFLFVLAGLWGLWEWERKRWDFYADQFSVEEHYRPWRRKAR